jgi:hypothetical protein
MLAQAIWTLWLAAPMLACRAVEDGLLAITVGALGGCLALPTGGSIYPLHACMRACSKTMYVQLPLCRHACSKPGSRSRDESCSECKAVASAVP